MVGGSEPVVGEHRRVGRGRRIGGLVAVVVVAAGLLYTTAPPPAQAATPKTESALGCGTNMAISVIDAPVLVAALMIQGGSYTLRGDKFNCVLYAKEVFPRFGFLLAGGAKNLRVTLSRAGGCLIICTPLPGPRDIKVTVTGSAGGCLGFMMNVQTAVSPNRFSFQCLAITTNIGATILTGLDGSGGLSTLLGCPKGGVAGGSISWPRLETQSWQVNAGSPGSVNAEAPFQLLGGEFVSDFIGKFVNPLIMNLFASCAGANVNMISNPVQVGVGSW